MKYGLHDSSGIRDDSEFMCQVVMVTSVRHHPDADRLDLVKFAVGTEAVFPYEIVGGRGEFAPGDMGVYISPDAEVPLSGTFDFLNKRLDAKGKTRYRIRSARLRGVFSPGLLIPCYPGAKLGEDMAAALNVTPWVSPAEREATERAAKSGTKSYQLPDRFPIYTVTALKKAPHLFEEGEEVIVTEKIHGTNFRFGYGGCGKFFYGTHRTALADTRSGWRRLVDFFRRRRPRVNTAPGYGNPWGEAVEKFELAETCQLYPDYVFYGELFGVTGGGKSIQDLTYGQRELALRIFDIWDGSRRAWLSPDERDRTLSALRPFGAFSPVPSIYAGQFHMDDVKQMAERDSSFGGIREGVVVESTAEPRRKGKWVSERYHMRKDS